MRTRKLLCAGCAACVVAGCSFMQPPPEAPLAVIPARQIETQKLTLGSVQSRVQVGAYSGDVIEALGSPNQVTSNSDGGETWVYDKLVTEEEYAKGQNSGVNVKSSRTLIVVVKFDKKKRVKDVQYRQTSY